MALAQGTKVKYGGTIIGYVAGLYDNETYPDIYTVIIPEEYRESCGIAAWHWDTWRHHNAAYLDSICSGKYVYNLPERKLQRCTTKKGNEI